jgi:DNA-binding cell septation regulator SpoVG
MIAENTAQVKPEKVNPSPNPWQGKIKVSALNRTDQAGTVKAFATIQIGDALEVRDCKVIQQPGQRAWVSLPDRQRSDGKGYAPIVRALDDRLKDAISATVLAAWQNGGVR